MSGRCNRCVPTLGAQGRWEAREARECGPSRDIVTHNMTFWHCNKVSHCVCSCVSPYLFPLASVCVCVCVCPSLSLLIAVINELRN